MNKQLVTASLLITLTIAALAWLLDLPAWLSAPLAALAVLPLPWRALQRNLAMQLAQHRSLHSALGASQLPALLLDAQAAVLSANPAFVKMAGLSPAPPAAALLTALPALWQDAIRSAHQAAQAQGSSDSEILLPLGENSVLLRAHSLRLSAPDGAAQTLLLWHNLSDNNQSLNDLLSREQHLLSRSQAFVQTLMDVIPQPVYVKHIENERSTYALVNTAFCALHNRSRSELVGKSALDIFNDQAHAAMIDQEDLRVRGGMPVYREDQAVDEQTGKDRFSIICKQACEDAEGQTVIIGTHFDITPWRMAERNLNKALQREIDRREQAQQFIQRIIDVIPYPVHVKDSHSRYLMINDAFVRERGRSREELLGQDPSAVAKIMLSHDPVALETERARAQLSHQEDHDILNGGTLTKEEHNFHSVTGAERFRTVFKSGCLDTEGRPAIVTAFYDVTQWRIAEREKAEALERESSLLHSTQAFIQRLIDIIPQDFYVKDAAGHFLLVNQAFRRTRNLPDDAQVIGLSAEDLAQEIYRNDPAYANDPVAIAKAVEYYQGRVTLSRNEDAEVLAGKRVQKAEHRKNLRSGEEHYFMITKAVCENVDGTPVIVCANIDITALCNTEESLQALGLRNTEI